MSFFVGFLRRKISEDDLGDLHGKVVLITGGNTGIGLTTIQFLARKGAKVYMASRKEEGYKDAVKRLEADGLGDGSVHWLQLDLSDPRLASKSAREFLKREDRLDILINNAAKGDGIYNMTEDGIKETMQTNYLSHFVFTEILLPLLIRTSKEEGSDVRILNLTSTAHNYVEPATFQGKQSWNIEYGNSTVGGLRTYGLSKIANILHISHLQKRLNSQKVDITCIAVDPGAIQTENVAKWIISMPYLVSMIAGVLISIFFVSPREGAMNSVYAAASPEVKSRGEAFKGVHLTPVGRITAPTSYARDERLEKELYDTTLEIISEMGLSVV